jgi:hypothetical protein
MGCAMPWTHASAAVKQQRLALGFVVPARHRAG